MTPTPLRGPVTHEHILTTTVVGATADAVEAAAAEAVAAYFGDRLCGWSLSTSAVERTFHGVVVRYHVTVEAWEETP